MEQITKEDRINTLIRFVLGEKEAGENIDEAFIEKVVEHFKFSSQFKNFTEEDWKIAKFRIETNVNVQIDQKPIILADPNVERWIDHKRGDIDWHYWNAYKKFLLDQNRSLDVIKETEKTIDEVLDCSGDPNKEGAWKRRGLVMGNVQSGKTQNYLGLINKSIDAGYKVIIVLGGHLNELRAQTQERLDEGVIGAESLKRFENKPIGVGKYRRDDLKALFLTTTEGDFSKKTANSIGLDFLKYDGPIIFVIKKLPSVMEKVYEWITDKHGLDPENGKRLSTQLMLIDDEADYASINTKYEKDEVTSTNGNIRKLLSLFERSAYIGYTATPFANIFIDPDEEDGVIGDDLFPKDFMIRIPTPDNYVGQKHFFLTKTSNLNPIVIVDDNEKLLPNKSKKDTTIGVIPETLKDAVRCFIINVAVRAMRGDSKKHNTMLINMTHLTILQNKISDIVEEYVDEIRHAAEFALGYSLEVAVSKSEIIADLKQSFIRNYTISERFEQIFPYLKKAIGKTKVFPVHSQSPETLDYSAYRENGLSAIVVGGHKLSRGLTLEGLSVSYFTRNSKAYDTLMQMCRWFGYRPGYRDLCKLFITSESCSWYQFIAQAIDELYLELERMSVQKKTPSEFGLKVREHPGSLLITARQKMNASHKHTRSLDLVGTRLRKFDFYVDEEINRKNFLAAKSLIDSLFNEGVVQEKADDGALVFHGVEYSLIKEFISNTQYVEGEVNDSLILDYIANIEREGLPKFSVCIKNITNEKRIWWTELPKKEGSYDFPNSIDLDNRLREVIIPMKRLLSLSASGSTMRYPNQEIGDPHDEKYFIPTGSLKEKSSFHYIRHEERNQPGLIIYAFSVGTLPEGAREGNEGLELFIPHKDPTISYSISFPVLENQRGLSKREIQRISKSTKVSYIGNQIWKSFGELFNEECEYDE